MDRGVAGDGASCSGRGQGRGQWGVIVVGIEGGRGWPGLGSGKGKGSGRGSWHLIFFLNFKLYLQLWGVKILGTLETVQSVKVLRGT